MSEQIANLTLGTSIVEVHNKENHLHRSDFTSTLFQLQISHLQNNIDAEFIEHNVLDVFLPAPMENKQV